MEKRPQDRGTGYRPRILVGKLITVHNIIVIVEILILRLKLSDFYRTLKQVRRQRKKHAYCARGVELAISALPESCLCFPNSCELMPIVTVGTNGPRRKPLAQAISSKFKASACLNNDPSLEYDASPNLTATHVAGNVLCMRCASL